MELKLLEDLIIKRYPNTRIKYKCDYWYWRVLPECFQMSASITKDTIWLPHRSCSLPMLAHKYAQYDLLQKIGLEQYLLLYCFPQFICLFGLLLGGLFAGLGLTTFMLLPIAIGLIFLLPIPSENRVFLVKDSFVAEIWTTIWMYGFVTLEDRKKLIDSLSGWGYYKMISKKDAEKLVDSIIIGKPPWLEGNAVLTDVKESIDVTTGVYRSR